MNTSKLKNMAPKCICVKTCNFEKHEKKKWGKILKKKLIRKLTSRYKNTGAND